jgi:GMP synthase (glutamine-hydrolysing)
MRIIVFQHGDHIRPGRLGLTLRDHGFKLDIRRPDKDGNAIPPDMDDVHGVISLGGEQNVGDPLPWLAREAEFLKEAHRRELPVIGICLGHQLIAHALGGQVAPMTQPEVGFTTVMLPPPGQTEPMLAGIAWGSPQFQSHSREVTQLPPGATLLASSKQCKMQAFKAGIRTYGFQFHFECDRAMVDEYTKLDTQALQACGIAPSDAKAQADQHYDTFARYADRLCVNLATLLFPDRKKTAG